MATPTAPTSAVGPSTLITVKVLYNDNTRRFKIPLKELGARTLPQNLRQLLSVPDDVNVIFERYSDSAGNYVHLDSQNPAVYKQLYRAAKAKLKLRIKATTADEITSQPPMEEGSSEQQTASRYSYLETVLGSPLPESQAENVPITASASATDLVDNAACPIPAETQSAHWETEPSPPPNFRDFVFDGSHFPVVSHASPSGVFCIDCNRCGLSIPNEHYHCSICDNGDYDLCPQCVNSGATCLNEEHWLIRRVVKDGQVTNSTTETIPPRKVAIEDAKEAPTVSTPEPVREPSPEPAPASAPPSAPAAPEPNSLRICNDCLKEHEESKMVSCADCDDYDLCITCLLKDSHGHHPAHTFALVEDRQFALKSIVQSRCNPGRHHHHAAICDGCEKRIIGVRYKCLTCPDWDYCTECYEKVPQQHPGHRFAPLYDTIAEPLINHEVHYGIYCDGPLCRTKSCPTFITGTRYKCSVCHDTDFCASCEVHPTNTHNRTHPLLMLKTPVRDVRVSTFDRSEQGVTMIGDRLEKSLLTESATLGEPEQTVQEASEAAKEAVEEPAPVEQASPIVDTTPAPVEQTEQNLAVDPASGYQAFFIRDTIPDDTAVAPNTPFQQTWTLFNPGPLAWPAGTDVQFVGGDSMFNVDTNHPLSLNSIAAAMESNKLSQPLEPGQSADFTVTLKTPSRLGTAISYWRLKLPTGMPFGHRLWCDIQVRNVNPVADTPLPSEDVQAAPAVEADQPEPTGSQMIFPKLEKESPESSTHEAAITAPSVSYRSEQDVLDDMDSLTLDDETDVGLLTDEEYDILDASDQEYLEAKSQH